MKKNYTCSKCGGKHPDIDELRMTGAGFTRYFNIQNRKFTAVSCRKCGYTELYKKGASSGLSSVLDFVTN